MFNRIRKLEIHDRIQSPTEAELWVFLEAEHVNERTEVRGRLTGPTCPYADTVEVAYPLRRFPKTPTGLPALARRVVIPEPSYWDPVSPFLYQGTVELWQDDELCERRHLVHGLRAVSLSPRGLFWNGSRQPVKAVERTSAASGELHGLHQLGFNALILPGYVTDLWEAAAEIGFAVFGRTFEPDERFLQASASAACVGWIIPAGAATNWEYWQSWAAEVHRRRRFLAVELEQTPRQPLRAEIDFVIVPGQRHVEVDRPRLVRVAAGAIAHGELGQLITSASAAAS